MTTPLKRIVIVGGGAGGLEMATQLGKKLGRKKKAKITLVDRNHSHLWKPLLHEVATGSLDEGVDALSYLAHARNHGLSYCRMPPDGCNTFSGSRHLLQPVC